MGRTGRSPKRDKRGWTDSGRRDSLGRAIMVKHDDYRGPEYTVWKNMIGRCAGYQKRGFRNYGGRGISVCEKWRHSFSQFLKDVGRRPSPKHSLERKNNERGYEPRNVRWATRAEQARNTRRTAFLVFKRIRLCKEDWAKRVGLSNNTLTARLRHGWSVERALTEPVHVHSHNALR